MILHVKDEKEALILRTNILEQMIAEGLLIGDIKLQQLRDNQVEKKINQVEESFVKTGFTTIKIASQEINAKELPVTKNVTSQEFKINIHQTGDSPFKGIGNLFVLTIDKSKLG